MAIASENAKFIKAAIKPLKKLIKNNNNKMAKIEKNIFITSIIANIAKIIEKVKARKNILTYFTSERDTLASGTL